MFQAGAVLGREEVRGGGGSILLSPPNGEGGGGGGNYQIFPHFLQSSANIFGSILCTL